MEYSANDYRYYIAHHGIKNQRWGVKNGPPYPLNDTAHDRVVKGIEDSKRRMNIRNASEGWIKKFNSKDARKYLRSHPVESIDDMARIPKGTSIRNVRYGINHSGESDAGRHYNCPNCAAAFDMTERGYFVEARPKPNGSNVEDIEDFYVGGKLKRVGVGNYGQKMYDVWDKNKDCLQNPTKYSDSEYNQAIDAVNKIHYSYAGKTEKAVIDELKRQKDGSWGIIVVGWRTHFDPRNRTTEFHAINYKIERGQPTFYDTQSKKLCYGYKDSSWIITDCDPREVFIMPTSDLSPSDRIGEAVNSRRRT